MGSRGSVTSGKNIDISNYNIENKKWTEREKSNLRTALTFITSEFGDISELTGKIMKRSDIAAHGLYDRDGYKGRGRAVYINTSDYADTESITHELTHAITEDIFTNYKKFGYKSRNEFASSMRSEAYKMTNKKEPKYDGRKWADRPEEFLSNNVEYLWNKKEKHSELSKNTLKVIKKYWKSSRE